MTGRQDRVGRLAFVACVAFGPGIDRAIGTGS
jgi:hypothetical protein